MISHPRAFVIRFDPSRARFLNIPLSRAHNTDMLTSFVRTLLIYAFLLAILRLMGKKQLGELQPFELAITLVAADLACIPMSDTQVPIVYGLVPIFTLFLIEVAITLALKKSMFLRRAINGKPVIVITPDGIDGDALAKLEMTVGDLNEALRSKDVFSPTNVRWAIVETNGDLSVITDDAAPSPRDIPFTLICDGKHMDDNLVKSEIDRSAVNDILQANSLKVKDALLLSVSPGGEYYLQPRHGKRVIGSVQ